MISFNIVLGVLFVLLLVSVITPLKREKENEVIMMDKTSTLTLRGLAILGIVLHHCTNIYDNVGPFYFLLKQSGYALTAVFFLFSGYGCWYSIKKFGGEGTLIGVSL